MKVRITKKTINEPVSIEDAKTFLRVDDPYEDVTIGAIIQAARDFAESYTARKFLNSDVQANIDKAEKNELFVLPYGENITINEIDADGVKVSASDYKLEQNELKFNKAFKNVVVKYTVGYGSNSEAVPASIKHAILMLTGALYEQRSDLTFNLNVQTSPITSRFLLNPYRLF